MKIIMDISDRILALNQGKRIAFDIPKNISQKFTSDRRLLRNS